MNVFGTAAAESLRHVENNIMHAGMTRVAMLISDHERVIEPLAQALDDCDSLARDIIDHVGFLRSNPQPVNRDRSTPRKKNMSSRGFAMVIDDENDDDGDEDDGGALVENDQVLAELMGYLGEAVDMFKKMADVSYRIKVQKSVVEGIRENISWRRNPDGTQVPTMPVSIEDPQNIVCEGEVMASAVFQSRLKQKMSEYEMKSDADKYHQVQQYVELIQAIWELDHPDDPFVLHEGDGVDNDEDIAIVDAQDNLYCPITTTLMDDPYTSSVCHHSFSHVIIDLIRQQAGQRMECPVAGCRKYIKFSDLSKNRTLAKKVERKRREIELQEEEETR